MRRLLYFIMHDKYFTYARIHIKMIMIICLQNTVYSLLAYHRYTHASYNYDNRDFSKCGKNKSNKNKRENSSSVDLTSFK